MAEHDPTANSSQWTFSSLYAHLQTLTAPLTHPTAPVSPSLSGAIAALSLHPTLEAALHLLNTDLPAAHFLVRHMEAPPAYEGMILHAILHRIEGDFDNARAWYTTCQKGCTDDKANGGVAGSVWPAKEDKDGEYGGVALVGEIQAWDTSKPRNKELEKKLASKSRDEIGRVVQFCSDKFGTRPWNDARGAWAFSSGVDRELKEKMILGDRGYRQF